MSTDTCKKIHADNLKKKYMYIKFLWVKLDNSCNF